MILALTVVCGIVLLGFVFWFLAALHNEGHLKSFLISAFWIGVLAAAMVGFAFGIDSLI